MSAATSCPKTPISVHVLHTGYSRLEEGVMKANCSCVLIKGEKNAIVDTMTAWDREKIIDGEYRVRLRCSYVAGNSLIWSLWQWQLEEKYRWVWHPEYWINLEERVVVIIYHIFLFFSYAGAESTVSSFARARYPSPVHCSKCSVWSRYFLHQSLTLGQEKSSPYSSLSSCLLRMADPEVALAFKTDTNTFASLCG